MHNIDLHLHTTYSDGTKSPEELITFIKGFGITTASVTDHDITDGTKEAIEIGQKLGMEMIAGIEINCLHNGNRMEILGYFIDPDNSELNKKIKEMREFRETRLDRIIEKLKKHNMEISKERVLEIAGEGSIGRPHIAQALLEKGYVSSPSEAFEKYLADGGPCHVDRMKLSAQEAITLIKNSGGIPVHSHPGYFKGGNFKKHLTELKAMGLMGIEVIYPYPKSYNFPENKSDRVSFINLLKKIAQENDLLMTGGTDFHGNNSYQDLLNNINIPYEWIERLKEKAQTL